VKVELSRTAKKQLTRVPSYIVRKFALWVDLVNVEGLEAARAVPGFRDHGLKGEWQGYRAVRLSDAYRAIYTMRPDGGVEAVYVEEVNKHDY
jgi:toxin HigB-1